MVEFSTIRALKELIFRFPIARAIFDATTWSFGIGNSSMVVKLLSLFGSLRWDNYVPFFVAPRAAEMPQGELGGVPSSYLGVERSMLLEVFVS